MTVICFQQEKVDGFLDKVDFQKIIRAFLQDQQLDEYIHKRWLNIHGNR